MKPDFISRLRKLRTLVNEKGMDAVLVSSPRDIFYYAGSRLGGDAAFLLVYPKSKPLLLISCLSNYAHSIKTARIRFFSEFRQIADELSGCRNLGFDEKGTSADFFMKLKRLGIRPKPFSSSIKAPRMIKDELEIAEIKKAVRLTERIFGGLNLSGRAELEISKRINMEIVELGVEKAFNPIVASGRNSSFIHYLPGSRRIKAGDSVIVDIGIRSNGYCSDMTRTFCKKPSARQKKVYGDLLEIQKHVIDNVRAGVRFDVLENFSKGLYERLGYRKLHSIGHGIGLSVHERPASLDTVQNGMVFTVEPGIYIKNWGGCRIEDVILVKNNRAVVLSGFSRELTP